MWGIILRLLALLIGFILDMLLGDPRWMPHPIRGIGRLIGKLEKSLRQIFKSTKTGELVAGVLLVIFVSSITTGLTIMLRYACSLFSPWLVFAVDILMSYQILAAKGLRDESMKVYYALKEGDLPAARYAVSMIVGRDTDQLDHVGVTKAAVETVAENTSDGVIAPILFLAVGGTPLGIFYKACNTMDSMVGYKNNRYLYFGKAAAIWDDILNFIPSRLSGILMCIAAFLTEHNGKRAFKIYRRDRKNHKSPNAAHTEAACAGALGVQLAGNNYYFGKLVEKPTIGDFIRAVEIEDIPRTCQLMFVSAFLSLLIFCIFPIIILFVILYVK